MRKVCVIVVAFAGGDLRFMSIKFIIIIDYII